VYIKKQNRSLKRKVKSYTRGLNLIPSSRVALYIPGFGYSYPSSAVPKILQKLKDFRPIPMEDAFFTGIH